MRREKTVGIIGPSRLAVFDAATNHWTNTQDKRAQLRLPPEAERWCGSGAKAIDANT